MVFWIMVDWSGNIHFRRLRGDQPMRPTCWRFLTRCGVHTMSSALGMGVKLSRLGMGIKLGGAINHLTLVVVSFGRCVVLGAGVECLPGLVVYWFTFCNGFSICVKKKKRQKNKKRAGNLVDIIKFCQIRF